MRIAFGVVVAFVLHLPMAGAVEWRVGDSVRLQLESTFGVQWSARELRSALDSVANSRRIAIWLDRRVDPGHLIELDVDDVTLRESLQRLASSRRLGMSQVGSVIYFGPADTADKLATLAAIKREQVRRLGSAISETMLARRAWSWDVLTTPRELLDKLAAEAELEVANADDLPHDLWAAGDYPALPLADRLTLLLAGFGLCFDVDGDEPTIRLLPMPATVELERTYAVRNNGSSVAERLVAAFPDASIEQRGRRIAVVGRWEDHEQIDRILRGEPAPRPRPKPKTRPAESKYDLRVENKPAAAVVQLLAQREQLTVNAPAAVREKLTGRVSLTVKDASVDKLLTETLKPLGIAFKLDGDKLTLSFAE